MARCRNTRPTLIYWLLDVRPEILVEWPNGLPFYCGKTVDSVARFTKHRSDARRNPEKEISKRIIACGDHVKIKIMESVLPGGNWAERERFYISSLRLLWPNTVNVTSGGQGMPGHIQSPETRAKRSASMRGRTFSPEHRARIGLASANRDPDVYRRIGESQKGRIASPETRAKISAAGKGRKLTFSPEHRANLSAVRKGKTRSLESRTKQSATMKERCSFSSEHRARISAALKGRKRTPEHIANLTASRWGKRAENL